MVAAAACLPLPVQYGFRIYILLILLEGNFPKPGNPYGGPINQQPSTNKRPTTNNLLVEELKYSHNRAWRRQHPTNNLLEVWQNLAPSGGRPIGAAV
jgi:hypothetical protein